MLKDDNISHITMEAFPANPIHGKISLGNHCMEGLFNAGPGYPHPSYSLHVMLCH